MSLKNVLALCVVWLVAASAAPADTISPMNGFATTPDWNYSFTGFNYGCQFEFGCGTDQTFGPVAGNDVNSPQTAQPVAAVLGTLTAAGAAFAYQEVDDQNGNPVDFVAFDNGATASAVTFTVQNVAQTVPFKMAGFATTIYSDSPFNATVQAYDVNGNLLGTQSFPSTEYANETYLQTFTPTYAAIVGVLDIVNGQPAANIASLVVTTDGASANFFGFGSPEVKLTSGGAPQVTSVTPNSGSPSGGTTITISGSGFTGETSVTLGGAAATNVIIQNDTTITAKTPAGTPGSASVIVTTSNGSNAANALFTYGAAGAPPTVPPLQILSMGGLSLQVTPNLSATAIGGISVVANQNGGSWTASTATPWLTLANASGAFPGAMRVTANAQGMGAGTYSGSVTVTGAAGGTTSTLTVPVTLAVLPPASITSSASQLPSVFGYPIGSATGYDVQIGPAGLPFTVQTSDDSKSWLSVTPLSGVGPATIHVAIDPGKGTYGTYQDAVTITSAGAPNSPLQIPAKMLVSSVIPTLPQEVNAATGAGPDRTIAPNEIASLFLSDFSCATSPVVSINGAPVGWSSYNAPQINYAVPITVAAPVNVSVACNGATAWSFGGLNVAATIPGIFTSNGSGSGQATALNADGSVNSASNPAARGSVVSIYMTGLGIVSSGVTAQIGGVSAAVQGAGTAPGNISAVQKVDVLIPSGGAVGAAVPVVIQVNGTPTQAGVTIAVK